MLPGSFGFGIQFSCFPSFPNLKLSNNFLTPQELCYNLLMNPESALQEFHLTEEPSVLPGGSKKTYKVGNIVLKHVAETSLENNHSQQLIQWIAGFSDHIVQEGFRIPRAIKTAQGQWITHDGWTAWTFLEGKHAIKEDIPACIQGIIALHKELKGIAKHPLMDDNRTPWGKADKWCWDEKPLSIQPELKDYVDTLYKLRKPVGSLEDQLIHADLNPENILIAQGLPPAFLDLSPFWRPPEFALAIFANFIGPRRGDGTVLRHFAGIKAFDQMLIRAGIRMLLVMSVIDDLEDWKTSSERQAAQIIIDYITSKPH